MGKETPSEGGSSILGFPCPPVSGENDLLFGREEGGHERINVNLNVNVIGC